MPELPEVETTTKGLQKEIIGLRILDAWTDLTTKDKRKVDTVSNPKYFQKFKKEIIGEKVISVKRRAKNILINLTHDKTILVHLKMTGHLLYGKYKYKKKENKWLPDELGPLADPYNRFIHVVLTLNNKKHLAFCDARKFGKMTLLETSTMHQSKHLKDLGPEPLEKDFDVKKFQNRLTLRPKGNIKTVLMDQSLVVGVGNIYSDEILWHTDIHPERKINKIINKEFSNIFKNMKKLLSKGIDFGGDSMSDYRNIYGLPGEFQTQHRAYLKAGEKCTKKSCTGVIIKKVINNRSAHFCSKHQK